jgi:hypothetical protein
VAQKINVDAFERAQRINNEIVAGSPGRDRPAPQGARRRPRPGDRRPSGATSTSSASTPRWSVSLLRMQTLVHLYVKQLREVGIDVAELPAEGNRAE